MCQFLYLAENMDLAPCIQCRNYAFASWKKIKTAKNKSELVILAEKGHGFCIFSVCEQRILNSGFSKWITLMMQKNKMELIIFNTDFSKACKTCRHGPDQRCSHLN